MSTAGPHQKLALSLTVNVVLCAARLWAAMITGSSTLLAEAVRSLTDASSQGLMRVGMARGAADHRGHDASFWSFVVAILLYALAAGIATYEGVDRLNRPRPIEDVSLAYALLAGALVIQAGLAWAAARKPAADEIGIALRIQCSVGVLCAAIALIGLVASDWGRIPAADGMAAICIGLLLAVAAAFMALEVRTRLAAVPQPPASAAPAPLPVPAAPPANPPAPEKATATATPAHPHGTSKRKGKRRRR